MKPGSAILIILSVFLKRSEFFSFVGGETEEWK
jgi:hypothetical protein